MMTISSYLTEERLISLSGDVAAALKRFEYVANSLPEEYRSSPEAEGMRHDILRRRQLLALIETEIALRQNAARRDGSVA